MHKIYPSSKEFDRHDTSVELSLMGTTVLSDILNFNSLLYIKVREHSESVVECLTRDRGAVGSSLTGVTVLCP